MNKKVIAKELMKIAKELVSGTYGYYYQFSSKSSNMLYFYAGIDHKLTTRVFGVIESHVERMASILDSKCKELTSDFNKLDFVKNVRIVKPSKIDFAIEQKDFLIDGLASVVIIVDDEVIDNFKEYQKMFDDIFVKNGFKKK